MDREEMQELRQMVHTHGVGLMPDFPDYEQLLKVLYDHKDENKTDAWFAMKRKIEILIEDWIADIDITASLHGLHAEQGRYDRSECITLDIVHFIDDPNATDGCYIKVVHRVQFHKHYPGYCFQQSEIKRGEADQAKASNKRRKGGEPENDPSPQVQDHETIKRKRVTAKPRSPSLTSNKEADDKNPFSQRGDPATSTSIPMYINQSLSGSVFFTPAAAKTTSGHLLRALRGHRGHHVLRILP
jgi:hypothetical protein